MRGTGGAIERSAAETPVRPGPQSWEKRLAVARDVFVPWVDATLPLAGKTVLEYGSGTGAVSCAFASVAGAHIGYDIDADAVVAARQHTERLGLTNSEALAVDAESIFDAVRAHRGDIDVFLLYAVLEHMTIAERLEALEVARDVVRHDGVIVVIETPNRLVDFDYHTSQLPFFSQLPPELGLAYHARSPRPEFKGAIAAARERDEAAAILELVRWGSIGVSYHEFELAVGDLRRHVVAGGYDPLLLGERTIHVEEVALARYLARVRPDLAPCFSRCWLDLILSPEPIDPARVAMIHPWPLQTLATPRAGVDANGIVRLDRGEPLAIDLPAPTKRLICVVEPDDERAVARLSAGFRTHAQQSRGGPHHPRVLDFLLKRPRSRFELTLSCGASVVFVGYEAGSDRAFD